MVNKLVEIKKVRIFTAGTFDLFHSGHLNILKNAKAAGDYLIVGVSTDDLVRSYKEKPIMSYEHRCDIIRHINYVDEVVQQQNLFDVEQFKQLNADYYVIGDDWKNNFSNSGLNWLRNNNKILFFPYTKGLSTTMIKKKIIRNTSSSIYKKIQTEPD